MGKRKSAKRMKRKTKKRLPWSLDQDQQPQQQQQQEEAGGRRG